MKSKKENIPIIISNNCWGYHFYINNNLPYCTPFVGLFMYAPDYIKFLSNFEEYMNEDLTFTKHSKYQMKHINYAIGLLKDVEIHFLHYATEEEAFGKWNRRKARMHKNLDKYFFKFDDLEKPFDYSLLKQFHELPFKNKISFTKEHYPEFPNNFSCYFGKVLSGGRLYKTTPFYFDIDEWFTEGRLRKTFPYRFYNKTFSFIFN